MFHRQLKIDNFRYMCHKDKQLEQYFFGKMNKIILTLNNVNVKECTYVSTSLPVITPLGH